MVRTLFPPSFKFPLGTPVLYKPKRPDAQTNRDTGKRAVVTGYSRFKSGGCFIELATGGILRVPDSDIEALEP